MSSNIYSGLTAGIKLKTGANVEDITFMSGFELEMSQEIIEVMTLGKTWKDKFPGIKTWSGSCDGVCVLSGAQQTLFNKLNTDADNSTVELIFVLGRDKVLQGDALVSEFKMSVKAEDKVEVSFSFEGIGPLVEAEVAA